MNNLERLGDRIEISLPFDEEGYIGRECPDCEAYFKIVNGTGYSHEAPCHCPYCGHVADHDHFYTQDQIEYAQSVVVDRVMGAMTRDFKDMARNFNRSCSRNSMFSMSMSVETSNEPLHHYCEEQLETHVECSNCTLKYAVYGVFAYCPDCGQHNSLQILENNLELVSKVLALTEDAQPEVAQRLVETALVDAVSAFDGYGHEVCRLHAQKATAPSKATKLSFQGLGTARDKVIANFNFDLSSVVDEDQWTLTVQAFQKRHLLAHKMGVIDENYIKRSGDTSAIVGRRITVSAKEVKAVIQNIKSFSDGLKSHLEAIDDKEAKQ